MKNSIKKIISIVLCAVMLFAMGGFASSAATYSNPVFSLTVVSENDSQVVVSLNLVSGKYQCLDFQFKAVSGYRCVKLERGEALSSYFSAGGQGMDEKNVSNGKASAALTSLYSKTGSFYKATFVKSNGGNFKSGDITVVISNCSVLDGEKTVVLTPKVNYSTGLALNETSVAMNYKDTKALALNSDVPAGSVVTWKSSNTKVVTVDENGNVYAAGTGDATVTCTVTDTNGKVVAEATCDFNVSYTIIQWIIIIVLFGWLWY